MATYPVPPSSTPSTSTGTRTTSSRTSTSSGTRTTSSRTSSRSGSTGTRTYSDPYAQARADAASAAAKAATRYTTAAARLKSQAYALKLALGSEGFLKSLRRELANSDLEFKEEDALILGQYARGKEALEKQKITTDDNRGRSLQEAGQNSGRERNEALQQGIENGISATDMIKAQGASLRNWSFNAQQVQTNYTDEINGLQSEHSQMVNSVITSRQTAWREREQQKAQLYRGYYDNRSQVLTEVGNKLGEAAQYYDMANEQKKSSTATTGSKTMTAAAMAYLRDAAKETGKGYAELAAPTSITKWQGSANLRNTTDPRQWGDQTLEMKDAEGASSALRRWEA